MMIQPSNLNNYLVHILVGNQYLPSGLLVHDFLGLIIQIKGGHVGFFLNNILYCFFFVKWGGGGGLIMIRGKITIAISFNLKVHLHNC